MTRRLRDAIVLNLVAAHAFHFAVAVARLWSSTRVWRARAGQPLRFTVSDL